MGIVQLEKYHNFIKGRTKIKAKLYHLECS